MTTHNTIRLHEHAGRVALHVEGLPTFYINTSLAAKLGNELTLAANQIKNANHYPTTTIKGE